jgi:hypothetical protein
VGDAYTPYVPGTTVAENTPSRDVRTTATSPLASFWIRTSTSGSGPRALASLPSNSAVPRLRGRKRTEDDHANHDESDAHDYLQLDASF